MSNFSAISWREHLDEWWWYLLRTRPTLELLWSRSYGSWIYNYLCNQCLSPLMLWVRMPFMARCTRYNIMCSSLSVTCGRLVVSSTNKTDRHEITDILLKVVLNTLTPTLHCRRGAALLKGDYCTFVTG